MIISLADVSNWSKLHRPCYAAECCLRIGAREALRYIVHSTKARTYLKKIKGSLYSCSYLVNVVQFGIDQLPDASTDEITSFITWYVWTNISGCIIVAFTNMCVPNKFHILVRLLVCFCLTLVLILSILSKNMLIKEPVTQNPFKLVYKVVRYAINNKRPRCRSAFTYCEDELPSRIDFGKSKYEGPFTTEQVESFFRLLSIIFLGCTLPGVIKAVTQLSDQINYLAQY